MLLISQLKNLCTEIIEAIPAIDGGFVVVIDEDNAMNKLANKPKTILVASAPSAQSMGQISSSRNNSIVIFWILTKKNTKDEIEQLEALQPIALQLQTYIHARAEEGCNLFNFLELDSLDIDPVYNQFGGYNGWSLVAVF